VPPPPDGSKLISDELIVGLEPAVANGKESRLAELARLFDLDVLASPGLARIGAVRMKLRGTGVAAEVAARMAALPDVRYAEPNAWFLPCAVPTDPLYAGVGGRPTDLQRWAFGGIDANKVLDAEEAWDITKGDSSAVICVVDSGTDLDNPEFQNLWVNRDEVPGNGKDDDKNGYVDDVNGYDFIEGDGDVSPSIGDGIDNDFDGLADNGCAHGTYVASIISAAHDDGVGMAGAAPGCALMTARVFGDDGGTGVEVIADAMAYAADNGADVVNLSFASGFNLTAMREIVDYLVRRRVIIVAAAGNGGLSSPLYPASYPNVIAVGGSGGGIGEIDNPGVVDERWDKSQYGYAAVDVVAPAVVLACSIATVARANAEPELRAGQIVYDVVEGTSFAAPLASALCGLVVSRDRELHGKRTLDTTDVESLVARSATDLPKDRSSSEAGPDWDANGRIEFVAALKNIPGASPPKPVITGAYYRGRQLRVIGNGFSKDSTIEVNGYTITLPQTFSYARRELGVRGSKAELHLSKKGQESRIVVWERGTRSPVFVLQ
jgi:hypothetical protein